MLKGALKQLLQESKSIILIVIGTIIWSVTMVKSGLIYSYGMGFWGANGHDGIWHIALIESLSKGALTMPVFSVEQIKNYHIGFDIFLALINKLTSIPVSNLYFQIIPPILALLIGVTTYYFVFVWTKSKESAWWSTFFVYFAGGFEYLLFKGESVFWSQQAISTLINPPFALSLVVILTGLIYMTKKDFRFKFFDYVFLSLLFGTLIEIKVYAGLLVLGALLVIGIWNLFTNHKPSFIILFICSIAVSLVVYLPLNKISTGMLIFTPFWYLETMMGFADRLDWQKFYSAMTTYRVSNNWIKMVPAYTVAFIIFILGNFGTRAILFFRKIKFDILNIFIYSIILAGIVIPLLFVQKGTPWNTIQFFYYSLFFSSILAGISVSELTSKIKNTIHRYIVLIVLIILTIPTTIFTLRDVYIPSRPPAKISGDEITALTFLSKQPEGVVLTQPFDQSKANIAVNNPPRPLYLYASTAYVSAFSKHPVYLEDEINLDITDYPWKERKDNEIAWFNSPNRKFLDENNIKYIYWIKYGQSPLDLGKLGLNNIFENDLVTIYMVK